MAKKDTEVKSLEERVAAIETTQTEFSEWRRRISTNWKRFVKRYVGDVDLKKGSDGELGFVDMKLIGAMVVSFAIAVGISLAVSTNSGDIAHWGSAAIRSDGSFTTDGNIVSGGGTYTNTTAVQTPTIVSNATLYLYASDGKFLNGIAVVTNATVGGTLAVTGVQTFTGLTHANNLFVHTNAVVAGTLTVTGAVSAVSTVGITGLATVNNVLVKTNILDEGSLVVVGNATVTGNVAVVGALNGAAITGTSVRVSGNGFVGGNAIIVGTTTHTGAVTFVVAPVLTVVSATNGAGTLTLTNAPTTVNPNEPQYFKFIKGSSTYICPGWEI